MLFSRTYSPYPICIECFLTRPRRTAALYCHFSLPIGSPSLKTNVFASSRLAPLRQTLEAIQIVPENQRAQALLRALAYGLNIDVDMVQQYFGDV